MQKKKKKKSAPNEKFGADLLLLYGSFTVYWISTSLPMTT